MDSRSGMFSFLAAGGATLERAREHLRRIGRLVGASDFRRLGAVWFTIFGFAIAAAGVLQALGPPPTGPVEALATPAAADQDAASATSPVAARTRRPPQSDAPSPSIPDLLARARGELVETPDGPPAESDAAHTLRRVAEVLPKASPADRGLATAMASDLYDRAKTALVGGRIDEEQRWLALGSILAPPPDLAPGAPLTAERAAPPAAGQSDPDVPQDVTPNEAEAEANAPAPPAHSPTAPARPELASATGKNLPPRSSPDTPPAAPGPRPDQTALANPEPAQTSAPAGRAEIAGPELPAVRPPGVRPPVPDAAESDAAKPEAAEPPTNPEPAEAAGTGGGVAIHFLAGSDSAEARAKALTERLGDAFGPAATRSADEVPPGAIIAFGRYADHARAKAIGEMLGSMGYPWRLKRTASAQEGSGASGLDVWLPDGDPVLGAARPRYGGLPRYAHLHRRSWWAFVIPRWF